MVGKFECNIVCRVITPMFMEGADGVTPELRPSEFKGMMRWWWRAMKSCDDISMLAGEESRFFGGTGEGQGKSKVMLRIIPNNVQQENHSVIDVYGSKYRGVKYLYYSTFALRVGGERLIRKFIKPGSTFSIKLSAFDAESFRVGVSSLWLAIYLGGFGTRSRRGGGNLEVVGGSVAVDGIRFDFKGANNPTSELKNFLERNVKVIKGHVKVCDVSNYKYTNLRNAEIILLNPCDSWLSALETMGSLYMDYRKNLYHLSERGVFGMPIVRQRRQRLVPCDLQGKRLSERWASPIILKVVKASDKSYIPMIVVLTPGGVPKICVENQMGSGWVSRDSFDFNSEVLDKFINEALSGKIKERFVI